MLAKQPLEDSSVPTHLAALQYPCTQIEQSEHQVSFRRGGGVLWSREGWLGSGYFLFSLGFFLANFFGCDVNMRCLNEQASHLPV